MEMSSSVTVRAQRNQILFGIIPQPAARAEVVDLKISRYAAVLATAHIVREFPIAGLAGPYGTVPPGLMGNPVTQGCRYETANYMEIPDPDRDR